MKSKHFLFLPLVALTLTSCTGVRHKVSEYVLKKTLTYHDNFKILQLTDIHLGDKDYQDIHYKFMDLTIKDAINNYGGVDFIAITGDLFTVASKTTVKKMINFFNSYKIPWTCMFGNHDEQCYFNVDWLTDQLNNAGKYCYFKDIQDDDVFGNCNFAINVTKDGNVFEQFIVMDSNRYCYNPQYMGYDYFKEDQIAWYKRLMKYNKEQTGDVVPSMMFYHIPLPEINDAWDKRNSGEPGSEYITGEKNEDCCPPKYNSGFFKVIKDQGSTHAMFFGHDHVNNFIVKYQGIVFAYGIKSTERIYYEDTMMGGRVITLKNDHSLEYQDIYHTYGEVM